MPWLDWRSWLAANGEPALRPAGSLRFKLYDQVIQAAVGGQGVALGRIPLIAEHLRDGRLVAPFPKRYDSARGYYAIVAPHAVARADVADFVAWLAEEAAAEVAASAPRRALRTSAIAERK
jgi:DNA-binding transcriptional LysR family regulator